MLEHFLPKPKTKKKKLTQKDIFNNLNKKTKDKSVPCCKKCALKSVMNKKKSKKY